MRKGFTLVELIVVITILTILGTLAFLNLRSDVDIAKEKAKVSKECTDQ